ncbi:MAG: 3-deoxy-8-phosphooctulonate synthase [bacterium]|nr:3-deoxy-8-phosphooctulonate synthase [bacterium]
MDTSKLLYIAGPCVIESADATIDLARALKDIVSAFDVEFVFKASFDKANRTSADAYRGPGLDEGLRILAAVRDEVGVPVVSDVHAVDQVEAAADVLDMIQIPAFLCRQTDLLVAAGRTGKPVNIKKGQFVAPADMEYAARKVADTGNANILLTERGASFGYNNLVVDFRSFSILRGLGYPVIFDVTHSVQLPSKGGASSGDRRFVIPLARAAAAYGIDGLFTEVHPNPDEARCDGPNSIPLNQVASLLEQVTAIRAVARNGD